MRRSGVILAALVLAVAIPSAAFAKKTDHKPKQPPTTTDQPDTSRTQKKGSGLINLAPNKGKSGDWWSAGKHGKHSPF
jgi:hypothetical protein